MKKIYSYYQSIALSNQPEEFTCANWWKQSWTKNGWEPIMLNRSHAQGSPMYQKLQQKLMATAHGLHPELTNRFDWIIARFIRWCALHAAGGGWMSDYDVFNQSLNPEIVEECEKDHTLQVNANGPAYLIYATKEHCENAIKKFVQEPLIDGKRVREEWEILGLQSSLYPILPLVCHVKAKDGVQKSAILKNLAEDNAA